MARQSFLAFFLLIFSLALLGGSFWFWSQSKLFDFDGRFNEALMPSAENRPRQEITLLFVGDIMLNRGVEWEIQKNGGDWRWPFLKIAPVLQQADLLFGNLESQVSNKGQNVGSIYSFRADPRSVEGLIYAGFDVLSTTNNHSFDYGKEALEDSVMRLEAAGIKVAPATIQVQNTLIRFLAYQAWGTQKGFEGHIRLAKTQADIVVVSLHAGEEYAKEPNAFQRAFAKTAMDEGADLLVGHHSHVVQPVERYNEGWIAYGLGNFVFDQKFSEETMQGAMLRVVVEDKKIKEVSLLPTRLTPSYQVHLVE